MKKNLLLITAFLAIAGTAMAVTPAEIGKDYHKTTNVMANSLKEEFLAKFKDAPNNADFHITIDGGNLVTAEVNAFNGAMDSLLNLRKADLAITNGSGEYDKAKVDDILTKYNDLGDKWEALEVAIEDEMNKPATKEEDKKKLAKALADLDKLDKKTAVYDSYAEKLESIKEGYEGAAIKPKNDVALMDKNVRAINPESTITEIIYTEFNNGVKDLFDAGNEDITALVNAFTAAETTVEASRAAVKTAEKNLNNAKAGAPNREALEDALEAAKEKLVKDEKVMKLAEEKANGVLKLANTNVKAYSSMKAGNDKIAEKTRIEKELKTWKDETKYYKEVASMYVYGKDVATLNNSDATNAALRITENAMNIENNKKAIARNAQDIKDLRKDHNRGMAQMAAMASVDFGNVKARTVKVGAGIGQHSSETAVAVGVAVTPTDALMVNAKWSTSASSIKKSTLGLGATYEFNF